MSRWALRPVSLVASVLVVVGCTEDRPAAAGVGGGGGRSRLDAGPVQIPDGAVPLPRGQPPRRDGGPVLPRADDVVVLPFEGPTETVRLSFEADVGRLDVHFNVDTTGSIQQEIDALQDALSDRIVSGLRDRVEGTRFGVSRFEDFPEEPFGGPDDRPFALVTAITGDFDAVASAVASLDRPLGNGGDTPESGAEALYQIATGAGWGEPGDPGAILPFPGPGALGVGFREDALRTVVHITDAPSHAPADYGARFPGTRSLDDAARALADGQVRVLGIASNPAARPDLERLARSTGARVPPTDGRCPTGLGGANRDPDPDGLCPLVFDVDAEGGGLADSILDALVGLLGGLRFSEVRGRAVDDRLRFVVRARPEDADPPEGLPAPVLIDDPPEDGEPDAFGEVSPGTRVTFAFDLRNTAIRPADYEQVFRVRLEVQGDGVTLVEEVVRIVVPIATDPT